MAAIQKGDEPEDRAALAHQLRWAAPHYDNAVALPWPLTVAKKLAEYVMPVQLLELITEEEDIDDDSASIHRLNRDRLGRADAEGAL